MNILEIIKKAPEDHVYYSPLIGECHVDIIKCKDYPIIATEMNNEMSVSLSENGKYIIDSEIPEGECVLFPSRDNRDWEAFERELMGITEGRQYVLRRVFGEEELPLSTEIEFEGGGQAVFDSFCGISEINLDHEYYKNHPYIDFQIDGKEYKVSTEDMKRLAMNSTKDMKERLCVVEKGNDEYSINIEDKEKNVSGKSFSNNTFDGTAEIVSIPDRPMMAAVIMSGMLAGGCKDKDAAFVNKALNKALHLADLILDETETKTKEE